MRLIFEHKDEARRANWKRNLRGPGKGNDKCIKNTKLSASNLKQCNKQNKITLPRSLICFLNHSLMFIYHYMFMKSYSIWLQYTRFCNCNDIKKKNAYDCNSNNHESLLLNSTSQADILISQIIVHNIKMQI